MFAVHQGKCYVEQHVACKMAPSSNMCLFSLAICWTTIRQQRGYLVYRTQSLAESGTTSELWDGLVDAWSYLTFKALGDKFSALECTAWEYASTCLFLFQIASLMTGGYFRKRIKRTTDQHTSCFILKHKFYHLWRIISSWHRHTLVNLQILLMWSNSNTFWIIEYF